MSKNSKTMVSAFFGFQLMLTAAVGFFYTNQYTNLSSDVDNISDKYVNEQKARMLKPYDISSCERLKSSEREWCIENGARRNNVRKSEAFRDAVDEYVNYAKNIDVPHVNALLQNRINMVRPLSILSSIDGTHRDFEKLSSQVEQKKLMNNSLLSFLGIMWLFFIAFFFFRKQD